MLWQGTAPTKFVLQKESSWDRFHKQRVSYNGLQGNSFGKRNNLQNRSKNFSHCRDMS